MWEDAKWHELEELAQEPDGKGMGALVEANRRVVEALNRSSEASTALTTRNLRLAGFMIGVAVVQAVVTFFQLAVAVSQWSPR
jgi:hypothetical protein